MKILMLELKSVFILQVYTAVLEKSNIENAKAHQRILSGHSNDFV